MPAPKSSEEIFLWPPPKKIRRLPGYYNPRATKSWAMVTSNDPALPKEAYRLEVRPHGIAVCASDDAGFRAANATARQLAQHRRIPCLQIEDAPDFPVRGFMLDISRGKVPTREELGRLVLLLEALKFNHLQLYVEHTFAFKKHARVWKDASPLSAEDLVWLQEACDESGLEFSANFNSFGHFERWLKHPQYKHLAECPDGFVHPLKGKMAHGTTLRPNAASLKFLDELWREYLPLFKSPRFNLGGDEPWELGLGASKSRVKKLGKHRVYLDFLKKLHRLAAKHGKEMLFWGDILLESPELVNEVPQDATALLWGYEADHPFAQQCARLAAAKRNFWVCPGTSAWNTFTGRTDNMLANLESAAKHGLAHGAEGLLLTSWGDGGNHQPWPIMYPALVYAAGLAWNRKGTPRADLARAVDFVFCGGQGTGLGDALLELGRAENAVTQPKPNRSRHHALFFANEMELAGELKTLSPAELKKISSALTKAQKKLAKIGQNKSGQETFAKSELQLGLDMAAWAVQRAQFAQVGKNAKPLAPKLRALIQRFKKIWLLRARPGGLHESTERIRAVEKGL